MNSDSFAISTLELTYYVMLRLQFVQFKNETLHINYIFLKQFSIQNVATQTFSEGKIWMKNKTGDKVGFQSVFA